MARNYAALPHEYLEEMDELSDAEFGRLCRALLEYSMTGKVGSLSGNERMNFKRVRMQEDKFQASYDELIEKRKEASQKGVEARRAKSNQALPPVTNDDQTLPEVTTDNHRQPQVTTGHHRLPVITNTETKTETETNTLPSDDGRSTRDPVLAIVMGAYLDKINPTPSQASLEELQVFAKEMGAECCLRAFDIALDAKKANWPYIRGILRSKLAQGVRCLADWDAVEENREKDKPVGKPGQSGGAADPERVKTELEWMDQFLEAGEQDG